MNTGLISARYARALMRYTEETGGAERVAEQAYNLLLNPDMTSVKLEPELERFVSLLVKNGRIDDVQLMLRTFVAMYYKSRGYRLATLITAVPCPDLESKISAMLEDKFQCTVILDTKVDPALIGGFIVEIDDHLIDASVRNQIETIRRQFVIQNNRIV
ncbi:MAG: ATP synthase F1 subunit delta [Bacteroidales bacterium]|nr:ATP synthase F1 subunit delta [Bacteroidales bacterium]